MRKEVRTIVYDETLKLEAYRFEGIVQPFPNHFHEYYVIGFVENGERQLSCKGKEYTISNGSIILFNPNDNHACSQHDDGTLDYRGLNISKATMLNLIEEITGKHKLFGFSKSVIVDEEVCCYLKSLHEMIMNGETDFEKKEQLLLMMSTLFQKYEQPFDEGIPECRQEIEKACKFMDDNFSDRIYLDQICKYSGLSKSTLLRAFTREKGVTPYRYLETVRINEAKKMLEKGVSPIETAMLTGFSDQSHFTNYFTRFIGIAPSIYRDIFAQKDEEE
ncbi:helix-turn-helix domain-containing protein [Intestinibacter sp.]